MEESGAGMNLGCEEEKETCTGNRPRSHDPTPTWGNSSSVSYAAGQKKNERTLNKNARRRPPEAQARNAEMERARKKRLREGKLKEEEQRLVKQKLEAPDGDAEGPQLSGAPPGATAQEENTQPNLTRGGGYDTTNNMNLFLTQCCGCSNPVRNKKTLFDALIQQITLLEEHGVLDNHLGVQVGCHSVVGALRLVCKELEGKDPHAKRCDYSKEFRILLKDVLLSRIGKDIVGGMVKQARAKIEPKEETESLDNENTLLKLKETRNKLVKQEMQNMLLKQENESKDQIIEAQKQEIEQLRTANAALVMQEPFIKRSVNLSDLKDKDDLSDVGTPDLSDWPLSWAPSPTPSVKSEGAKTLPYGM